MTSSKLPNNELIDRATQPDGGQPDRESPSRQTALAQTAQHQELSSRSARETDTVKHADATSDDGAAVNTTQSTHPAPPAAAATPDLVSRPADERAEILKRIAAFRNLQIKLRQDREKYYDQTLARTRSLLSQPIKPRR